MDEDLEPKLRLRLKGLVGDVDPSPALTERIDDAVASAGRMADAPSAGVAQPAEPTVNESPTLNESPTASEMSADEPLVHGAEPTEAVPIVTPSEVDEPATTGSASVFGIAERRSEQERTPGDDGDRAVAALTATGGGSTPADTPPPPAAGEKRRRPAAWLAAAAAVLLVAIVAGANLVGNDDGDAEVATEPPGTTSTTVVPSTSRVTTSLPPTTAVTTTTVAGTADAATTTTAPTTTTTVAAPAPTTTVPPTTTTAAPCRNSTEPRCGAFRWDPNPTNRPATVSLGFATTPRAGESATLEIDMIDPDGPVTLACYAVNASGPAPATTLGACETTNFQCPERYGPWSPPGPSGASAFETTAVTFPEPGTYTVTVDVDPADGCDNVTPYRSGGSASITVVVEPSAT